MAFNAVDDGVLSIMYNPDNDSVVGLEWYNNDSQESYTLTDYDWYETDETTSNLAHYEVEDRDLRIKVLRTMMNTGCIREDGDVYQLEDLVGVR